MQKHEDNLAARINGNALQPLAGASVTVTDDATGLPAALYSDDGVTPLAQPVITGNEGEYAFYAANGEYTVTFSGTRFATFTRKVILADPSDNPYATQAGLAAPTGAALVGFMQAGEGAVPRTAEDKGREHFSPFDFMTAEERMNAYLGLGTIDVTAKIQAAMDALPVGAILNGGGHAYMVTSINFKSYVGFENFALKTKGGSTDNVSPITIDGRTTAKTNIMIRNVTVDGQRSLQTAILGTFGEDGGRHGARILGQVSNLLIEDADFSNCASDGMEFYSAGGAVDDTTFAFNNITLRNVKLNNNRRHGASFDSFKGVTITNVTGYGNGLDLNTTDDALHGNRGSRVGNTLEGALYGNGIDFEGYGVGSNIEDLRMDSCTFLGNARSGVIFYDTVTQTLPGFVARKNIIISNCRFDSGIDVSSDGNALLFSSTPGNKALGALYKNVLLHNNLLDGALLLRAADSVNVTSGAINKTGTYFATLDNATNVRLSSPATGTAKSVYADASTYTVDNGAVAFPANPTLAFNSGAAGTLANIVYSQRENRRNGAFSFYITADWTPSAGGASVFSLSAPAGATITDPAIVDLANNNDGLPVLVTHNPVSGYMRFTNAGSGILHKVQILVTVYVA